MFNSDTIKVSNKFLSNGFCPICKTKGIEEISFPADRATFDYRCEGCNKLIVITDLVLSSNFLDELHRNEKIRNEIQKEIAYFDGPQYHLSELSAEYFSGRLFNSNLLAPNYEDWKAGKLGAYPSKFEHLKASERNKIRKDQKAIFNQKLEERIQGLKNVLEDKVNKSISSDKFYTKQLEIIDVILNNSNSNDTSFLNNNYNSEFKSKISERYNAAIENGIDYEIVLNENQKYRFGSCKEEMLAMIDAMALNKLSEYINELIKSPTENKEGYFNEEQLEILFKKIDNLKVELEKLGVGQEIIFDEIDSLRENSKKLNIKDFKNLLMGKLFQIGIENPIIKKRANNIMDYLLGNIDTLNLLG